MTKRTNHFTKAIAFLVLISCGQQQNLDSQLAKEKVDSTYRPNFPLNPIYDKFEFCYTKLYSDSFGQIFEDWNRTIKPNSDDFIHKNDTIKSLYDVYKEFYEPFDLLKIGDWEWGNSLNSNCKYVIIQNKIFYSVLPNDIFDDFNWEKSTIDSIVNFRPPINIDRNNVLYLTHEYEDAINRFLGTESTEFGEGNIMNPSGPAAESLKRYEVIRSYIPILHGHWGGYWILETHPDVSIMIFNKSLTKVQIHYRVGYQGGEAILEKSGKDWTIKSSRATWIE